VELCWWFIQFVSHIEFLSFEIESTAIAVVFSLKFVFNEVGE
jgi:hypothetical protein